MSYIQVFCSVPRSSSFEQHAPQEKPVTVTHLHKNNNNKTNAYYAYIDGVVKVPWERLDLVQSDQANQVKNRRETSEKQNKNK